jgi:rhodanese-related sulfurtransferase
MIMKKLILAVAFFTAFSAFAANTNSTCANEEHYPLVSKSELKNYVQSKQAFVVDVNSSESFQKAHVPGAIHFESHEKDFAQMLPKDHNALIVAYCGGPMCSAWKKAAEQACNMGYTNVRHFKDGISGWVKN